MTSAVNSGIAEAAARSGALNAPSNAAADDDNSYVVGYMGRGGELEAGICSDAEIGLLEVHRQWQN